MKKGDFLYQQYVNILKEELRPAMGCTEPIAMAYAAAKARQGLGAATSLKMLKAWWFPTPAACTAWRRPSAPVS